MKTAKQLLFVSAALMLWAVAASADAPLTGTYQSTPNGSDVIVGHHSESWSVPANGFLQLANAIHAESWNGAALGTQWSFSCPSQIAPAFLLFDTVDGNGNGQKQWLVTYSGGTLTLNGTGEAWAGGDAVYTGTITSFTCVIVEQFANFVRTGADVDVSASGHFVGPRYPCFQWSANAAEEGNTDIGAKPAIFPTFLAANTCAATPNSGQWFDHLDITLTIFDCTVGTEDATWGQIKSLYGE